MPFSLPKLFPCNTSTSTPLQNLSTNTKPDPNPNPNPNALSTPSTSSRSLTSFSSSTSSSPVTTAMSDDATSVLTFPSLPSLQCLLPSSTSPISTSFLHLTSLKPLSTASTTTSPPALTISQSSLLLFTATPSTLATYELTSLVLVSSHPLAPSAGAVKSLVILPKSHGLLSAHQDTLLRLWRHSSRSGDLRLAGSLPTLSDRLLRLPFPKNYTLIRRHHKRLWIQHADTVSALATAGEYIYSVSWDKTLKIWRTSDLRCVQSIVAHDDAINALAITPDGTVYTGSADTKIRAWSRAPGEKKHALVATFDRHRSAVNALAISNDGSVLYSGANDRSIIVWEREESANHLAVVGALRGHGKAILCLASVGDMLFSGSSDRTVRIWRRGREGREYSCLAVMAGHVSVVRSIVAVQMPKEKPGTAESEEEYRVCSGSFDGEVRVWKVRISGLS
ncbi:Transducin/WD40 repeat-like superfamily protein [Rhynchospora pubera]|uniref:Transducin/WD40 repeat-like superfamily protein n=1 Tax=Rhynchospora pubera TaxID=906938 RepID=A0AAV8FGH7_9POAL|nr:Transducin/WD40 repeat-like superfamily protein [Rhynchospora pubera]